jgi:cytochrome c oxidase subunit II
MTVHTIPPALGLHRISSVLRRHRTALVSLGVLVLVLALAGPASADFWTPESGGSPNADRIDSLYKKVLVVAAVVFFGVEGLLLYTVFKFKARKGAVAAQIRGNTRLEVGWTVGAAVILVVLAVVTFFELPGIRNPEATGADGLQLADGVFTAQVDERLPPDGKSLDIVVNGQQYIWRYTYPDGDDNALNNAFAYEEMVVPTNTTVTLDIVSQDVVHSWWIPQLGGKFDAVPGSTNHTWFKISEPGVYRGQCAEMCGRNHANMVARVRAIPPAEFEQWLAQQRRDTEAADEAAAQQRREVEGTPDQDANTDDTTTP